MKIEKILLIFFIILSLSSYCFANDYEETDIVSEIVSETSTSSSEEPQINSRRVIVYERNSKTILYEKNSNEICKMASTTKIMTSILILENCDLTETVTISSKSASTGGSRLGLQENDTVSVQDLLYGLMLCSGNDAAVALAEFCSGSVDDFANLMNQKAHELGLANTNFCTPHGLDNDNHYTTAYDFAILTDYALNNPLFLQIVGTKYYTVTLSGVSKSIHNTNELLGNLSSVYGVKTGFTSEAGRCLISAAKQDNLDIIVVVFGADTKQIRTDDSINLINYIFDNYESVNVGELIREKYSEFNLYLLPYIQTSKASSSLETKLDSLQFEYYPIKKEFSDSIKVSIETDSLEAPIDENQPIAKILFSIDNQEICSTNILSSAYISRKTGIDYLFDFVINFKEFYQIY